MKTKLYLSALCLPLAFAACTNDDFENVTNGSVDLGPTVKVAISAEKAQPGVDTKMTINGDNQFVWEAGNDLLGAALQGGSGSNNVTAFPFTADESATASTFTGTSALPIGSYLFFYPYADVLDQKVLSLNMPEQTYDPAAEKTSIEQATNNMKMISPIIGLKDGVAYKEVGQYNLNVRFANLYTLVRVNITPSNIASGVTPSVEKITLSAQDASGNDFVKKASADLTEIVKAGTVVPEDCTLDAEELDAALEELETLIADGSIYAGAKKDGQGGDGTAGTIEYAPVELAVEEGCTLTNGTTTSLYLLAPKGKYNKLTLKVLTSEGEYTKEIAPAAGVELGNEIQPITATPNFSIDGNVILPTDFPAADADAWNEAVEFISSHATQYLGKNVTITLSKDITIDALPALNNIAIMGSGKVLTLSKDYTVNADNAARFNGSDVTLGVAEGATLTLEAAPAFPAIKNEGTLEVKASLDKAITNLGTMNVSGEDVTLSGGVTNGQVANPLAQPAMPEVAGTININAKIAKISKTALSNLVGDINIAEDGRLHILVASTFAKGTITNNGLLSGTAALTNKGTIDNYGRMALAVTNTDGSVIVEKGSRSSETITNGDVTVNDLDAVANYNFSNASVAFEVNNAKEYKIATTGGKINNVILNGGTWTMANVIGGDDTKTIAAAAVTITLKSANLVFTAQYNGGNSFVAGSGNNSITTDAKSEISVAAGISVNEGATLTIAKNVKVNNAESSNNKEATINGTLNVNAGAKMYFNNVTVGEKGSITAAASEKDANNAAVFGVQDTFTNNGTVTASQSTEGSAQVTQPTNGGTGTFNGNPTDIAFS